MKWLRRLGLPLVLSVLVHLAVLAGLGQLWLGQDDAQQGRLQVEVKVFAGPADGSAEATPALAPIAASQPKPEARAQALAQARVEGPSATADSAPEPLHGEPGQRVAAAPGEAVVSAQVGEPDPAWQGKLQQHLQAHMRYPRLARLKRQEGVAELHFEVGRNGGVLSLALGRSSGHPLLDEEALALITRAQPLPPPPVSLAGSRWAFQVPVSFNLR